MLTKIKRPKTTPIHIPVEIESMDNAPFTGSGRYRTTTYQDSQAKRKRVQRWRSRKGYGFEGR